MYNVDLPAVTVKFMHAREFMVQVPEHASELEHHFDITGDVESFEIGGKRREADRLYVVVVATKPYGQMALHSTFLNRVTHETSLSSIYVNAIPCKAIGGHRIEQGDEVDDVKEAKPKKAKEEKKKPTTPETNTNKPTEGDTKPQA